MVVWEAADLPAVVVGDNLGDDVNLGHDAGQRAAILHEGRQLPPLHPPACATSHCHMRVPACPHVIRQ